MSETTITFLVDHQVQAKDGPAYKAGEVVDVGNEASVEHFVRRGLAVRGAQKPKADEAKPGGRKPKA